MCDRIMSGTPETPCGGRRRSSRGDAGFLALFTLDHGPGSSPFRVLFVGVTTLVSESPYLGGTLCSSW